MPTNSYQVIRFEWSDEWEQFVMTISAYHTFEEALELYDNMEINEDCPEISLEYHQNSGCYLQKKRTLLHREWDPDLCEVVGA